MLDLCHVQLNFLATLAVNDKRTKPEKNTDIRHGNLRESCGW